MYFLHGELLVTDLGGDRIYRYRPDSDMFYLTRFPGAEGKWQVSLNGGADPRWDPRGRRLCYLQGNDVMEVEVEERTGGSVRLTSPRRLFTLEWLDPDAPWDNQFAISPVDGRFLFAKNLEEEGGERRMVLVRNWTLDFDAKR